MMPDADPTTAFIEALTALVQPCRAVCGAGVRWKDADLLLRAAMPAELRQHDDPCCLRARRPDGGAACRRDCLLDAAWWRRRGDRGHFRRCHAGIVEWIQPVFIDATFAGTLAIGPWRDERSPPTAGRLPRLEREVAEQAGRLMAQSLCLLGERRADALIGVERSPRHHPLAAAALARMSRRPRIDLRLDRLAAELGCHPDHCSRRLKAATGRGFIALREELVMQRARRLLADPQRSIAAIADDLGYRHPTHFAAAFRRHGDQSPAGYRRRLAAECP